MSYCYLVNKKGTQKQQLVEASSPSVAIAHVAGQDFTAQRVDGAVLAALKTTLGDPVKVGKTKEDGEPADNGAEQGKED